MKRRGGMSWAVRGLLDVGSGNSLACTRFHTGTEYSNRGGGMGTQPWYRMRHTYTGLEPEKVGVEPPAGEQAGSVPELNKSV